MFSLGFTDGWPIALYAGIVLVLFVFYTIFKIKILLKIVFNSLIGALVLILINLICSPLFSFVVDINLLNSALVGFLGIPGAAIAVIITLLK